MYCSILHYFEIPLTKKRPAPRSTELAFHCKVARHLSGYYSAAVDVLTFAKPGYIPYINKANNNGILKR